MGDENRLLRLHNHYPLLSLYESQLRVTTMTFEVDV